MASYLPTPRTQMHRLPVRAAYDHVTVHAILDEALVCHLGFVDAGQPFVIPTTFARVGETLYVHGAAASRTLKALGGGIPICVTVTLIDGLVYARSAFHHSMNYRSVVVFGAASEVVDADDKRSALLAFVDKVSPGRAASARPPSDKELRATTVLGVALAEVSAKVRTGGPKDDPEDMDWPVWAGHLPVSLQAAGEPVSDGTPMSLDLPTLPVALRVPAARNRAPSGATES